MLISRLSSSKAMDATAIRVSLSNGHLLSSSLQGFDSFTHKRSPYTGLRGPQGLTTCPPQHLAP